MAMTHDRDIDRLIRALEALESYEQKVELYEDQIFPLACDRFKRRAGSRPNVDLLYVPVGTQPYSPTLAVLANPAGFIALLTTPRTEPIAERVIEFTGRTTGSYDRYDIGDGVEAMRVMDIVESIYRARGSPRSNRVCVDVTSGRKATAAVLGAFATARRFKMTYIESKLVVKGLGVNERLHDIPSPRVMFEDELIMVAKSQLDAALWSEAAKTLDRLDTLDRLPPQYRLISIVTRALAATEHADRPMLLEVLRDAEAFVSIEEKDDRTARGEDGGEMVFMPRISFEELRAELRSCTDAALLNAAAQARFEADDSLGAMGIAQLAAIKGGYDPPSTIEALERRIEESASPAVRALIDWLNTLLRTLEA